MSTETRYVDPIVTVLVAERVRRGWTQREVVRRLGVSSATVCNWERGENSPTLAHLHAWAAVLDVQVTLTLAST